MAYRDTQYGTLATYGSSSFRLVSMIEVSNSSEEYGELITERQYIQVTRGNFGGQKVFCSWLGSEGVELRGPGNYAWGEWKELGWKESGEVTQSTSSANLTTTSGKYLNSYLVHTYKAPYLQIKAPTMKSATKLSDKQIEIKFTCNCTKIGNYKKVLILRSTDGGSYVQVGSVNYKSGLSSYVDKSVSKNHYYTYKVRGTNTYGSADSAASNTIYTTPSPISNLKGIYNAGGASVLLTWTNNTKQITKFDIQKADNASFNNPTTVTSTTTTYTDNTPPTPNAYYRVRVEVGGGYSAWSAGITAAPLTKPNVPAITAPTNGIVFDMPNTVTIKWNHKGLDGTPQTNAVIAYSTNGSSYTEKTITGNVQSYKLDTSSYSDNTTIYVKVKTKGNHASYSDYCNPVIFSLHTSPQIVIVKPEIDEQEITSYPIHVEWSALVDSGLVSQCTLELGEWKKHFTGEREYDITIADVVVKNHSLQSIIVSATSSYGLTNKVSRIINIDFDDPMPPVIEVTTDDDSGSAQIIVHFDTGYRHICDGTEIVGKLYAFYSTMYPVEFGMPEYEVGDVIYYSGYKSGLFINGKRISSVDGNTGFIENKAFFLDEIALFDEQIVNISTESSHFEDEVLVVESAERLEFEECSETKYATIIRVSGDGEEVIADNLSDMSSTIDPVPPLNCDYQYKVVSVSETGAINFFIETVSIKDIGWFFWNFEEGYLEYAKLRYNPSNQRTIENNSTSILFEGDDSPTCFGGTASIDSISYSGTAFMETERDKALLDLSNWHGKRAIYRTPFSEVIPVRVTNVSSNNTSNPELFDISISQERVL